MNYSYEELQEVIDFSVISILAHIFIKTNYKKKYALEQVRLATKGISSQKKYIREKTIKDLMGELSFAVKQFQETQQTEIKKGK